MFCPIIQKFYLASNLPVCLKICGNNPLYKKRKTVNKRYRPISVLENLSEIYEKILFPHD